ncbi:hypothetical protein CCOS865_00987 [Pseudomonas reidholzensis]|uniref:Uncharacterized protein n=1 Tax=Pseudomonas reidholzensis TaxID=1785162 RepID=A0A383RQW9_9PSED|nr:hypothetical protein [Pseudomonas reidholzensis]SYX88748.1 hypothetical protein CCOS865_00987 [Pseudomonas reidholzensis]
MNLDTFDCIADNAKGCVVATLPTGEPFVAEVVVFDTLGGVMGIRKLMQEGESFVYIGFPLDIEDGDHLVGQGGVSAHLGGDQSGVAEAGRVQGLKWNRTDGTLTGKFEFSGKDENGQAFTVTGGEFNLVVSDCSQALQAQTASTACAIIAPALRGNTRIGTTTLVLDDRERPSFIEARQTLDLVGGVWRLGAAFFVTYDEQGLPEITRAFATVDNGGYLARDVSITRMNWVPGEGLSFDFALSFDYNGTLYTMHDGRVDLKL